MQGKKLYVGNLDFSVSREELQNLFDPFGKVISVNIIKNKGFGFVEMSNSTEAENAQAELNSTKFKNRKLRISEAYEKRNKKRTYYKKEDKNGYRKTHKNDE